MAEYIYYTGFGAKRKKCNVNEYINFSGAEKINVNV